MLVAKLGRHISKPIYTNNCNIISTKCYVISSLLPIFWQLKTFFPLFATKIVFELKFPPELATFFIQIHTNQQCRNDTSSAAATRRQLPTDTFTYTLSTMKQSSEHEKTIERNDQRYFLNQQLLVHYRTDEGIIRLRS